jgi:rhodanese-related sulfurtransferase
MSTTEHRFPDATLSPAEVQALALNRPESVLLDVRTAGEFQTAHIDGALNLPLDQVEAHAERIVTAAKGPVVLVCQSGGRAEQARRKLSDAGVSDATVLAGGMNAWTSAGAPVEQVGDSRWALERQVRLVAGSIVLVSVLASIWLPALSFVAGAVGAGLTFAAITNSCMMGMLLAKLPYNRAPKADVDAVIARIGGRVHEGR